MKQSNFLSFNWLDLEKGAILTGAPNLWSITDGGI